MEVGKFFTAYGRIKMSGIAGISDREGNVLIKKSDYEKYRIILPYRFLFGKRRQNYLSAELEKLHPCFSDEFCFDPDFIGLSRKGISADVMVMHKYKLAEYENRHPVTGSGFLAENCDRHRYFVAHKYKVLTAVLILLLVILGFSLISWVIGAAKKEGAGEELAGTEVSESEEGQATGTGGLANVAGDQTSLLGEFFEAVRECGGSIASIYWHTDGFTESLEASVQGLYPERLGSLCEKSGSGGNVLQTIYEQGIPSLDFSVQGKVAGGKPVSVITGAAERMELCREVRIALAETNAVLKRESFVPYKIIFSTANGEGVFAALAEILEQHKKSAASIKLEEEKGRLEAEVCIEEAAYFEKGIDLKMISENTGLFFKQKKKAESQIARADVKKSQVEVGYKKIGQIKNPDGRVITFYKTGEGKIKRIMEEN